MSINRFTHDNGNVNVKFPRHNFNCRCSIKEELKMSKFIPKAGDTVLSGADLEYEVLYVGKEFLFARNDLVGEVAAKFDYFQPMPKKVDIERKQLVKLISTSYNRNTGSGDCAKSIQDAGFTIPKKITRIDIENAIFNGLHWYCDLAVDNVCQLLGDLVKD